MKYLAQANPYHVLAWGLLMMTGAVHAEPMQLEEIIVTAEKRQQSLQDVAAAVTAFSETFIEDTRIANANELVAHIPGLHLATFTRIQSLPALRGAHSGEDGPGLDQPVAVFVDDVYKGRVTDWDLALFDLERIEVLRGPQGTLFGRNVVGGLINVVTKKPTEETRIVAEAGSGNFNLIDVKGVFSAPISKERGIYGSLAFASVEREGYTLNPVTENKLDSVDKHSLKAQLRFAPGEKYEVLWQADMMRDTGFGFHRDYLGDAPTSPEFNGWVPDENPEISYNSNDGGIDRTAWGTSLVVDWYTKFGSIKSITAYYQDEAKLSPTDVFGSPLKDLFVEFQEYDLDQFSQEIRFHGEEAMNGKLDWIVGAYYLAIDHTRDRSFGLDLPLGSFLGDLFPGAADPQTFTALMTVKTDSYAGFAQGTYSFTDEFRLTLGGRYTHDKKVGRNTQYGDAFIFSVGDFSLPLSASWSKFTPRITFEKDFGGDIMLYATYSEGFKSGGFIQFGLDEPEFHQVPLNPETAENFELGLRSIWLNNRLVINVTAYKVDYTDLQVSLLQADGTFLQTNAGKAEAEGIDIDINAAIGTGLTAWLNYSYFDGTYTSFGDFTGNEMVAPPNAYTFGVAYDVPLATGGGLRFVADIQHKDEYFQDPDNEPGITNGLDSIVNANVTWSINSNWAITLWGKNLTDERAFNYVNNSSVFMLSADQVFSGQVALAANYIAPLTWGLSARYTY